jgi:hypothetical protein
MYTRHLAERIKTIAANRHLAALILTGVQKQ